MQIKTNFKVGDVTYQITSEGKTEKETLHEAIILSNPPQYCHECKNDQYFSMDANKDRDGNIYINVLCKKCGAKAKLGSYKNGGFFFHKFEKYVKGESKSTSAPSESFQNEEENIEF